MNRFRSSCEKCSRLFALASISCLLGGVSARETTTNQAVGKMVKAGLSESTIISLIQQQHANYPTKVADLLALFEGNRSAQRRHRRHGGEGFGEAAGILARRAGAVFAKPGSNASGVGPMTKIVDCNRGDQWVELLPEVLRWKTGGVLENIAIAGLIKRDVYGVIQGPSNRNAVKTPVGILIFAQNGATISEYQLLRLRQKSGWRESWGGTGGGLHASEGAARDLVSFEDKKIAPRMWIVMLLNFRPGEKAVLAPGAIATQHTSAQLGKIHTFRLLEGFRSAHRIRGACQGCSSGGRDYDSGYEGRAASPRTCGVFQSKRFKNQSAGLRAFAELHQFGGPLYTDLEG